MIPFTLMLGQSGAAGPALPGGGNGVMPVILGSATCTQTTDVTSHAITMPGSIAAGDYLLICFCKDGGAAPDALSGWTSLASTVSGSSETHTTVFARVAAGSDTATVTTSTGERSAAVALRISPATASYGASTSSGATTTPDCPALAPGIGLANFLWLAVYGTDGDAYISAGASGFTVVAGATSLVGASGASIEVYSKAAAAASEDPGTATGGGTTRTWGLITVGLRD